MIFVNIYKFYLSIMLLTPDVLLSNKSREQCINKLNDLPKFIKDEKLKTNAAVLVPLCVVNGEVCLLYTLRSYNLSSYRGQVSFPGGKMEKNENVYETAQRETEEEIGFSPKDIDIWTKMNELQVGTTNIVVTPIVGELKKFDVNKLQPNKSEVAEIFTVPMGVFCNKENHGCFKFNNLVIPVFICGKYKVWGITGVITHLFLQCFLPEEIYQVDFLRREYKLDELLPEEEKI